MTALPSALPGLVLRDPWSMVPSDVLRRTEMDDGQIAVSRKLDQIRTVYSIAWELDAVQYDLFVAWYADGLDAGRLWFGAPVVEGTRTRSAKMRWTKPPAATSLACGTFVIAGDVEIADLPRVDPARRMALTVWYARSGDVQSVIDSMQTILDALAIVEPFR